MSSATGDGFQECIEQAVSEAIAKRTKQIVAESNERMHKQLDAALNEAIATVVLEVSSRVAYERMGQDLRIFVEKPKESK